jgi:hypothetical protein
MKSLPIPCHAEKNSMPCFLASQFKSCLYKPAEKTNQRQKEHINLAKNQVRHNAKIKSRERKQANKNTN